MKREGKEKEYAWEKWEKRRKKRKRKGNSEEEKQRSHRIGSRGKNTDRVLEGGFGSG